jgi:hypothetical protein
MKWEFEYFIPFGEVTLRYISQFHLRVFFIIDYPNFNCRLYSVSPIKTLELIIAKLADVSNLSMILTRIVPLVYVYSHCTVFIHTRLDERLVEISASHE